MDIKHLKYFVAIAQAGSFTRAAIKMKVDQPALSKQIYRLEAELNIRLFRRHGRGIALTEAGQSLLGYARTIINNIEQAHCAIDALRTETSGTVVMAMPSATKRLLSTGFLDAFRRLYPKADLEILMGTSTFIQDWLLKHQADIGLINGPVVLRGIDVIPVAYEDLRVISPRNTRLIKPSMPVSFKKLALLPLILPPQPQPLRNQIEAEASRLDIKLNVVLQISGSEFILELVKQGHGFSVLPAHSLAMRDYAHEFQQNEIVKPSLRRVLNLATRSDQPPTPLTAGVISLLKQYLQPRAAVPESQVRRPQQPFPLAHVRHDIAPRRRPVRSGDSVPARLPRGSTDTPPSKRSMTS